MITLPAEQLRKYLIEPLTHHHNQRTGDADILEADDHLLVIVDTPGAKANEVDLKFQDGRITVRVDRHEEPPEGATSRLQMRPRSSERTITLPETVSVDPDQATATLTDNGTLEIRLPKR